MCRMLWIIGLRDQLNDPKMLELGKHAKKHENCFFISRQGS